MTTVFIGGSRAVSRLNDLIRAKLDDLMKRNCTVFIGDANGADKAVQQHLAAGGYRHVVVFCMHECRNNLGGWPTRTIRTSGLRKDFAYYAAKDRAMAEEAKCGVMLWDGRSKGTLNNILNLIGAGKKTLVYFAPAKAFHKLSDEGDVRDLLTRCDKGHVERVQQQLKAGMPPPLQQISLRPAQR
jgi:hypothetical protein